jgi:hypothetical protein
MKASAKDFQARIEQHYPGLTALETQEFSKSYSQFKILKTRKFCGPASLKRIQDGAGVFLARNSV